MSQNMEQNVRTRAATWAVVAPTGKVISIHDDEVEAVRVKQSHWAAVRHCLLTETEARGAEEQRRKDAEGGEIVRQYLTSRNQWEDCSHDRIWAMAIESDATRRTLYTRPANVAALEAEIASLKEAEQLARADAEASKARVTVLEGENNTLKTRVINAAENLLSIETPCMKGDNFAVTICSYFEDCEGETCDSGWHEGATKAYEEIKDAVLQHFRAALTREGGV